MNIGSKKSLYLQIKMGNSSSASETAGVKAQAEGSLKPIYSLLDLNGKYVHISHLIEFT